MSGVSIAETGQALGAIGQAVCIASWDACIVPLATDHVRYINIDRVVPSTIGAQSGNLAFKQIGAHGTFLERCAVEHRHGLEIDGRG